ncbi:MAG: hypothetical protein ACTJLM_02395 [Ehrlichia sp.]
MQGDDIYENFTFRTRRVVFYIPNCGVFRLGKLIKNVTPAFHIVRHEDGGIQNRFLKKVLIHDSRGKSGIKEIIKFVRSLGLSPVIYSPYDLGPNNVYAYKKDQKYNSSGCVFIISSDGQYETADLYNIILDSEKNFIGILNSEDSTFEIVEYDPSSKPLMQSVYDAIFYCERWSLLTLGEKILRCCFSVLSLAIPIVPPIILMCYLGDLQLREEAYDANLLPWQYRQYKKSHSIYGILNGFPAKKREYILLKLKQEAQKKGTPGSW